MIAPFSFRWLGLLTFLLRCSAVQAQVSPPAADSTHCLLLPLAPAARAAHAALVVEAEVLDARSFWDAAHQHLYTAHRLRVFRVLKGQPAQKVTVLTEGGTLGLDRQVLTNTLQLAAGTQGVFFLQAAAFPGVAAGRWTPYASQQGLIRYNLTAGTAAEPFRSYGRLGPGFYATVRQEAAAPAWREVQPNTRLQQQLQAGARPAATAARAVVTGLSPLSITAGTGAVLTITGSGFGSTRGSGYVAFPNADDGGATEARPQDADYVSWTDTRVQVRVPSFGLEGRTAGSGLVRVVSSSQVVSISPQLLTVVYAVSNVITDGTNEIVRPNHINTNNRGGYTFQPDANLTARAGASEAFQRGLTTWRCQTGVNWELGAQRTGTIAADDNANGLGFDNAASQLPARVLGRTTSYYRGCRLPGGTVVFTVKEIDMVFDNEQSWQFGPALPVGSQFDFESVVVHELGHAQQLSHLILPGAVMHYAIGARQVSRELDPVSEIAGGRFVLKTRSFRALGCGSRPMLPAPLVAIEPESVAEGQVNVNWTTAAECFVQEFLVERSRDTITWTSVGRMPANGSAGYRVQDDEVPDGLVYYRIGVVRPNGEIDYTGPQLVVDGTVAANKLEVFPNPVRLGTTPRFQLLAEADVNLVLRIYDSAGRQLSARALALPAGYNVLPLELPPGLRAGWYLLRWNDQAGHRGAVPLVVVGP